MVLGGGGSEHVEAMRKIALAFVKAHEELVKGGTRVNSDLCHNEGRHKWNSG